MEENQEQLSFQYANECDLEIHCSPFGLSGLYMKIKGTNIMGIGSTMGLITGSTKGLIYYNDSQDLMDQKYKLYLVVEDDDVLRVDFTKISPLTVDETTIKSEAEQIKGAEDDRSPASISTGDNSSYASSLKSPAEKGDDVEINVEEDELPALIFRGKCPDGRPDNVKPFIGIFSFERED